ncbi:MAG: Fic family protein [Holosporales bacterium]|jgi:Fic family protein|nr:Fic family protein [Holosporales bacterium]
MKKPPFSITEKITNLVGQISERIGEIQGAGEYNRNLRLRKINRIRSIQSSTAIEGNTLSMKQVSDIVDGKRIIGNPREIKEIKNAYNSYENMLKFNPFKVGDFLTAHKLITADLITKPGQFRTENVGVFAGKELVHLGAKPEFVPDLIKDLLDWGKSSDVHPLIKSSVIHFEIEFIHPFVDGNGRIGRLWQTLILAKRREIFAWIPVETIVYERQQEYYRILGNAEKTADSTEFIEFMLEAIDKSLNELPTDKSTDIIPDKLTDNLAKGETEFLKSIIGFIKNNETIDNYRAQLLTNKSAESVKKYFAALIKAGILIATGKNKGRKYKLNKGEAK